MPIIDILHEMRLSNREKALNRQRLIIEKDTKVNFFRQKSEKNDEAVLKLHTQLNSWLDLKFLYEHFGVLFTPEKSFEHSWKKHKISSKFRSRRLFFHLKKALI